MYFHKIVLVIFATACFSSASVLDSFYEHELIPDILSVGPESLLDLEFPNGTRVCGGNILTISQVAGTPIMYWNANPSQLYTVVFCDADPPSRSNPEARCFLHWLVVNIEGGDVNSGKTLIPLLNSHPEPGTGLHRYVFLVYRQQQAFNGEQMTVLVESFSGRKGFLPELFSSNYNLGIPVAGNFYQTENTEDNILTME